MFLLIINLLIFSRRSQVPPPPFSYISSQTAMISQIKFTREFMQRYTYRHICMESNQNRGNRVTIDVRVKKDFRRNPHRVWMSELGLRLIGTYMGWEPSLCAQIIRQPQIIGKLAAVSYNRSYHFVKTRLVKFSLVT